MSDRRPSPLNLDLTSASFNLPPVSVDLTADHPAVSAFLKLTAEMPGMVDSALVDLAVQGRALYGGVLAQVKATPQIPLDRQAEAALNAQIPINVGTFLLFIKDLLQAKLEIKAAQAEIEALRTRSVPRLSLSFLHNEPEVEASVKTPAEASVEE